jgi:hypothetical protein
MRKSSTITLAVYVALAAMLGGAAIGCSSKSPAEPSSTTASGDVNVTASITVPQAATPAANAQIRNADQPVTLVVRNAVITQSTAATYTFEVARDAAFANKVYTKSGVAEGSGQTGLTIDTLPAATDYYWRARAEGGGSVGPFSAPRKFTIGPAVIINAPTPIAPLNGAQAGQRPTFRVANAQRSGPSGAITYTFEIATSASFSSMVASGTQGEGTNETGFIPAADLPANATLFWRATATDTATGTTGPASAVQSFSTNLPSVASRIAAELGVELWPGAQPPGTNGHAVLGAHWEVRNLVSFDGVPFVSPPVEAVRLFDLMDRGMDPQSAIVWMLQNGYPSTAQYYPSVQVIGIPHVYLAFVKGGWELVVRVGA